MNFFKSLRGKILLYIFIPNLLLLLVSLIYGFITERAIEEGRYVVECLFKNNFHLYCLGCGGSRSLFHLLHFRFLKSFLYYPALPITLFLILDIDVRALLCFVHDTPKFLLSFKYKFLYLIPITVLATFLLRNFLLVSFGIDLLGDVTKSILH